MLSSKVRFKQLNGDVTYIHTYPSICKRLVTVTLVPIAISVVHLTTFPGMCSSNCRDRVRTFSWSTRLSYCTRPRYSRPLSGFTFAFRQNIT